jgi:hypothetical protein
MYMYFNYSSDHESVLERNIIVSLPFYVYDTKKMTFNLKAFLKAKLVSLNLSLSLMML